MRAVDYLGPDGPLARGIPGYEDRPSQLRMAEAVQDLLESEGVLLVEAGTGTGKTLAYLLPAILGDGRVVVSTGTRNLQDQIMKHDLPLLERHLDLPIDAACLKGLGNYLCLRRFEELRTSADAMSGHVGRHVAALERWRETTRSGDRAELEALPEDAPIWAQVTSGTETRIGPRCAHFEDCFVTAARRAAEQAQIVVVNHHLFFADLATRGPHGGGILPDYETVIFDEAHQIEDVVTQFFGTEVSTTRIEKLARDAGRALFVLGDAKEAQRLLDHVLTTASGFFAALPRPGQGRTALPREAFAADLMDAMLALDTALDAVEQHCRARAAEAEPVAQMSRRAAQIRGDLAGIVDGGPGSHVTWVQRRGRGVSIGSSPVDVSELLREELFYRTPRVVLTSATLSTGGSFDFIKRRLGLDFEVREVELASPFDYASQAALYVPPGMPDPRDAAWLDRATAEVSDLIGVTGGGAFVLCTSFRVMNELSRRLGAELSQPVLVQGQAPKAALLERFRDARDAVLFATASFWEGVDVPGDALRLVVIDKLPFEVPTDPLVSARCERMKADGEAPFMGYLVPSAALSLKQGFGRLVRTRRDRGIVAILDPRIVRKGYGRVFLRSLPEARRCETLDDVRRFWTEAS